MGRAFLFVLAAAPFVACNGSSGPNSGGSPATQDGSANAPPPECNAEVPDACPSPSPKYATDVVPILEAKCNTCHDGRDGGPWPLTNHADVEHWITQVTSVLLDCTMPPPTGTEKLTSDERATLLNWLKCGAPNN